MIAAHDLVPPALFPAKSGLQKPETFGSRGVIMCIKKRNRHGVFTPWKFIFKFRAAVVTTPRDANTTSNSPSAGCFG